MINLDMVYKKTLGTKLRKFKMIAGVGFIVGCLMNLILSDAAFFVVGVSVGVHGLLVGLERNIRKHMVEGKDAQIVGEKLRVCAKDSKIELALDKDSNVLSWVRLDSGEKIAVINTGIIACKVSEENENPDDSKKLDRI